MADQTLDQDRHNWRVQWLSCINQLANFNLQQRKWLDKAETNPNWSFVEFYNEYLYDCVLQPGYDWALERNFVTSEEVTAVTEFDALLRSYEPPRDNWDDREAILNDRGWRTVVDAAARAKKRLVELVNDPDELRSLMGSAGPEEVAG